MKQNKLNCPDQHSAYPGDYIPAPLSFEELLDELQKSHEGGVMPLVNVVEMHDVFKIELAAPGLKSDDFYVGINGNVLTISALHKDKATVEKLYHQHEFNYYCFKRDIILPENIDTGFLDAVYINGVLCVNLPKTTQPSEHRVARIIVN